MERGQSWSRKLSKKVTLGLPLETSELEVPVVVLVVLVVVFVVLVVAVVVFVVGIVAMLTICYM